jgi:hypothetical protein
VSSIDVDGRDADARAAAIEPCVHVNPPAIEALRIPGLTCE